MAAADGDPSRQELTRGVLWCLAVFLVARVWLSILGATTVGWFPEQQAFSGDGLPDGKALASPGWHNAWNGTDRWDAGWFQAIAADGYGDHEARAAFLPGYPLAVRGLSFATGGDIGIAALLVSNLAFLAALIVFYMLTMLEYSARLAQRASLLLAAFPTSFIFMAPYSESAFLLAALAAFWFARRGRWGVAGGAGAVAAFTRSIGLTLVPAILIEGILQKREQQRPVGRSVVAAGLVLCGPILYGAYWLSRGWVLAPVAAQGSWGRSWRWPFETAGSGLALGIQGVTHPTGRYWTADMLLTIAIVLPLVLRWRGIRPSYLVYAALSLLIPLSYPLDARPFLSLPRFAVVVFPAFWAMTHLVHRRGVFIATIIVSAAGWTVLATLFMNWRYVF